MMYSGTTWSASQMYLKKLCSHCQWRKVTLAKLFLRRSYGDEARVGGRPSRERRRRHGRPPQGVRQPEGPPPLFPLWRRRRRRGRRRRRRRSGGGRRDGLVRPAHGDTLRSGLSRLPQQAEGERRFFIYKKDCSANASLCRRSLPWSWRAVAAAAVGGRAGGGARAAPRRSTGS